MAGPLLDVFVVGSRDPSPVAQMRVASALATHFQVPITQIAQAMSVRNLRAGQALEQDRAHALAQQLAGFGAVTEFRPSVNRATLPTQPTLPTLPVGPSTEVAGASRMTGFGQAPAGATPRASMSMSAAHDTGPLLSHQAAATASRTHASERDPFLPPDEHAASKLELAAPRLSDDSMVRPSRSIAGAAGLNISRMAVDSNDSGIAIAEDPAKLHNVRCPQHGLYYDKRRASGCRKCLAPAAGLAAAMRQRAGQNKLFALEDNPTKRAFLGLAVALFVGFMPAAFYALRIGSKEVRDLRDEQTLLSNKVGTQATLARFDEIDRKVDDAQGRAQRNTLIIWGALAGAASVAWYRLT